MNPYGKPAQATESGVSGATPLDGRDDGSSLVLALVFILLASMLVLPLMNYTMGVTRANRVAAVKSDREEAVRGGLRAALSDPAKLYAACLASGRVTEVHLAAPPGLGVRSSCTTTRDALQDVPSDQRYALATTQANSQLALPPNHVSPDASTPELDGTVGSAWCTSMAATVPVPCGYPFPGNGSLDTRAWLASTSNESQGSTIFTPYLPPFSNTLAYNKGFPMPLNDFGEPCTVFFPGKYLDDVIITNSTPVYFVSGIYYFEKTVRISGDADVVIGAGSAAGCADSDAVAVADAIGAPFDAYSNGVGGTFVFGAAGRLVVDTMTPSATGEGASIVFNRRLVDAADPLSKLNGVSVMSVNGVWDGTATADLDIPGQLHVPETLVFGEAAKADAWKHSYKASTLISPATAAVSCAPPPTEPVLGCPIIDINLTTTAVVNVKIPGYVSVPQGALAVTTAATGVANKHIVFGGGILAAQMAVSPTPAVPEFMQLGLLNPVVQKTFKIVTETTNGSPHVVATALVQINETGGYAVNSWVTEIG